MRDQVSDFYDELAPNFHLLFEDWNGSVNRQAAIVGPLIERECGKSRGLEILDCACGIGTQALGLAGRGHNVTACDVSAAAVERARAEAGTRGLALRFAVADMRDLSCVREAGFDAVICFDNALPHLGSERDICEALAQIRSRLRPYGLFFASIRDYDELVKTRPVIHGPAFFSDNGRRRIVHQVWDWLDERRYEFHIYITREVEVGWDAQHYAGTYRAVLRSELAGAAAAAGFDTVTWRMPEETGYYQPVLVARRAG